MLKFFQLLISSLDFTKFLLRPLTKKKLPCAHLWVVFNTLVAALVCPTVLKACSAWWTGWLLTLTTYKGTLTIFWFFCYSGGTRSSPPPAFSKTPQCRSQNQFEKDRAGSCRSQILWLSYQWWWNTPASRKTWCNQKLPKTDHCQRPKIFSGCSKFLQGCNSKFCHHCGSPAQALARQEASFRTFGF